MPQITKTEWNGLNMKTSKNVTTNGNTFLIWHCYTRTWKWSNRFRRPLSRCLTSPIIFSVSRSLPSPTSVYTLYTSFYVRAIQFRCLIVRRFLTPLFQSWYCIVDAACAPTWPFICADTENWWTLADSLNKSCCIYVHRSHSNKCSKKRRERQNIHQCWCTVFVADFNPLRAWALRFVSCVCLAVRFIMFNTANNFLWIIDLITVLMK